MNFYKTKAWEIQRARILRLDGYLDQVALRFFGKRIPGNTVHHIYPRSERPEWQLKDWNLITVSEETHNQIENRRTGELSELGKLLQRVTTPGKDWRRRTAPPRSKIPGEAYRERLASMKS